MNRTIIHIALMAAALLCVSCIREKDDVDGGLKTITSIKATFEETSYTKAHLVGTNKMKWDPWDNIGVFSDTDNPVRFITDGNNVFTNSAGQSVSGHEFYAFYPYSSEYAVQTDNRNLLYFYGTRGTTGKNPLLSIPLVAKSSDGTDFVFKHTCGILHFSVTGSQTLWRVELKSNSGERIMGYIVNLDEDIPVLNNEDGWDISSLDLHGVTLSKDEPYDIWFFVPPVTLSNGFSLRFEYEGGTVERSTRKPVTISRGCIMNYSVGDLEQLIEEGETALLEERAALVALYNATDGAHWKNNTNWCSDKPLSEWYGISTDPETNRVVGLDLSHNGLNGALPAEMANLRRLNSLFLYETEGFITNLDPIFDLPNLEELAFGIGSQWDENPIGGNEEQLIQSHMMAVPAGIGKLKSLKRLFASGINADLPEEFFGLDNLETLSLWSFNTGRPLQVGFGKLTNLRALTISSLYEDKVAGVIPVNGTLPEDIFDLEKLQYLRIVDTNIEGELSPRIGDFKNIMYLSLYGNQFSGSLPPELTHLNLIENGRQGPYVPGLNLGNNHFSGKVPEEFRYWPEWQKFWGYVVFGNKQLSFTEVMSSISIPTFEITTLDGERIDSGIVSGQELTMLFQFATWCPFSPMIYSELKTLYPAYKDKGLAVISYSDESESILRPFVESIGFSWPTFSNALNEEWRYPLGQPHYPVNFIPSLAIFDKSGRLVFSQMGGEGKWKEFIESRLGESGMDLYESTDYSADGTVHTLQTATSGNGIDIVLMGDGYSDRLIADGTYASVMQRAAEAFFTEEPYKSFRDFFNVYYVDVVSKNERYDAETAFSTWYGEGTLVGGDNNKVIEYAKKVIPDSRMDDAIAIVPMNRDYYAGTCYMYPTSNGDCGRGLSISYVPVISFEETFNSIVLHEAAGHGFAKLADEYYYASNGTIPQDKIDERLANVPYGWWKNVDFTSDPAAVKWSAFLNDDRYSAEGLGVFEGAFTYLHGAWRPSRSSIMNTADNGFNAPSRYAIWYKIGKLAYGAGWNGSYEDFVAWDAINRTSASHAPRKAQRQNYVEKDLPPLTPPVVMQHSWRDLQH